jgi:hypothetical protein
VHGETGNKPEGDFRDWWTRGAKELFMSRWGSEIERFGYDDFI